MPGNEFWLLLFLVVVGGGHVTGMNQRVLNFHLTDAVALSTTTFDKVVTKNNVTLVMFVNVLHTDIRYREFKHFAESTSSQPQVLAAVVGITTTGKAMNGKGFENAALLERYGIEKESLPVIKLFSWGEERETFTQEVTCDNLRQFIRQNTGLWVGRPGAVEYLDHLAERFTQAPPDEQVQLKDEAVQYRDANTTTDEEARRSVNYYIKLMEEQIKSGQGFLGLESGRLKQLHSAHKYHDDMVCAIDKQMNILNSFRQKPLPHRQHDEL